MAFSGSLMLMQN